MTEKQYPSLPEQGKNLAKFSFDLIKNAIQTECNISPCVLNKENSKYQ